MMLFITGYVSLSTIIAGIILPITTVVFYEGGLLTPFGFFTLFTSIIIILKHRSNINRIIKGTESRFEKIMIFNKNN